MNMPVCVHLFSTFDLTTAWLTIVWIFQAFHTDVGDGSDQYKFNSTAYPFIVTLKLGEYSIAFKNNLFTYFY
ncbi:uncharacterized protein F4822DRAFT_389127, partial [Hypoxylon trugodes]|uniref:uncharacterized protein n=1 Tax=Hypoxylon trugodes TaxID=326681 RepID=UPI002190DD21